MAEIDWQAAGGCRVQPGSCCMGVVTTAGAQTTQLTWRLPGIPSLPYLAMTSLHKGGVVLQLGGSTPLSNHREICNYTPPLPIGDECVEHTHKPPHKPGLRSSLQPYSNFLTKLCHWGHADPFFIIWVHYLTSILGFFFFFNTWSTLTWRHRL